MVSPAGRRKLINLKGAGTQFYYMVSPAGYQTVQLHGKPCRAPNCSIVWKALPGAKLFYCMESPAGAKLLIDS